MQRDIIKSLTQWLHEKERLPLVLRGARQVGKTWAVRELARIHKYRLIELNFEKNPEFRTLFNSNDPKQIILNISSLKEHAIHVNRCILFLDEIQAAPELFSKLRWFAEEMQELAVIAAGSLLEFVLSKHSFSMPVGRINYAYLEPMSFHEFLLAKNKSRLLDYINNFDLNTHMPDVLHQELSVLFKEYMIIGGLPKAVKSWTAHHSIEKINRMHNDLLSTYRDDFAKYTQRLSIEYLQDTLHAVPNMLGEKFVYRRVNVNAQSAPLKKAVKLLNQAQVCHKIEMTSAHGLPLGAGTHDRYFKEIFIDVGLVSAQLGLSLHHIMRIQDINLINKGGMAEQVIGQLLRINFPYYMEPKLYYWAREHRSSNAELDYLIQHGNTIIPIEVKSGATGAMKSLHVFMKLRNLKLAVRTNSQPAEIHEISNRLHDGSVINYTLLSIPFYLINQLPRLIDNYF